ncbi:MULTISPECIES: helix-turn-helix domain-containing protein [Chromobacterium]|uniref:helix-turn-helix domain-containing protein n=1 Tax=Chromobacterium TaxID=535 RepID=UPI0018EE4C5C|nr:MULTISPECIES: helix-turn-helix transcriptional regulator [Chromobacterium]
MSALTPKTPTWSNLSAQAGVVFHVLSKAIRLFVITGKILPLNSLNPFNRQNLACCGANHTTRFIVRPMHWARLFDSLVRYRSIKALRKNQASAIVAAANLTSEEMEAELGEKLRRLRLNKNIDQQTLAARAGISVRALRNLESGQGSSVNTLLRVLRTLGRESWLQTIAPVPTINPLTLTRAAKPRQRASQKRKLQNKD